MPIPAKAKEAADKAKYGSKNRHIEITLGAIQPQASLKQRGVALLHSNLRQVLHPARITHSKKAPLGRLSTLVGRAG